MSDHCQHHNHCIESALSKAEIICRDHNLALTPIRQKVLQLVWEEGHNAVKAYDLLEKFKQDDPYAKPTTIYRALDFLIENHLIHKLESQNSFVGCNHPTRRHNCAFLICDQCKSVEECCDNGVLLKTIHNNVNSKDFRVNSITLEIHGMCKQCIQ